MSEAMTYKMPPLPERDTSKSAEQQGVFRKFDVRRTDGSDKPGGKHHGCEYFVLDVDHDPIARAALKAYANAVEATHPKLAADMRERYAIAALEHQRQIEAQGVPNGMVLVDRGALQMVVNVLQRDAANGNQARGEMVELLIASAPPAPQEKDIRVWGWVWKDKRAEDGCCYIPSYTPEQPFKSGELLALVDPADLHRPLENTRWQLDESAPPTPQAERSGCTAGTDEECKHKHCAAQCPKQAKQCEWTNCPTRVGDKCCNEQASVAQQEPVAGQCRFVDESEWKSCSVAHVRMIQSAQNEWRDYEVRLLYTHPAPSTQIIRNQALEEAAKVCNQIAYYDNPMIARNCADAIRAIKNNHRFYSTSAST